MVRSWAACLVDRWQPERTKSIIIYCDMLFTKLTKILTLRCYLKIIINKYLFEWKFLTTVLTVRNVFEGGVPNLRSLHAQVGARKTRLPTHQNKSSSGPGPRYGRHGHKEGGPGVMQVIAAGSKKMSLCKERLLRNSEASLCHSSLNHS